MKERTRLKRQLYDTARKISDHLRLTPGGDAYEYIGDAASVDELLVALDEWEAYYAHPVHSLHGTPIKNLRKP